MLHTYGLSQPFILSGDLRVSLAMTPPGSPQYALLEEHLKNDPFMQLGSDGKTVFYNESSIDEQQKYLSSLRDVKAPLVNRYGQPVPLQGNWARGTCVLVGSGPGVSLEAVATAQHAGATIITLGNACFLYKDSDIWIGNSKVAGYSTQGLESPRTMSLVPEANKEENLWDINRKEFLPVKVCDMPNVLYYKAVPRTPKLFFDKPCMTHLGISSSLTVGLSTAALLGFTNILLTGIDLGGSIDSFYAFPEIPHKETFEAKQAKYSQIAGILPQLLKEFNKRALRLYGIGYTAFGVPSFPVDMVQDLFTGLMPRTNQVRSLRGITIPDHEKIKLKSMLETVKQATLNIQHMFDKAEELLDKAPNTMDTPAARTSLANLAKALKAGGCSNCSKKSHIRPIYELFVQEAAAGNPEVLQAWEEMFPEQYVIIHRAKQYFRKDKADVEEAIKALT